MEKKINVVTGANGHIGVALCVELKERGEYVRAVCRSGSAGLNFLRTFADEVVFADIRNIEEVEKVVSGADTVFHLAGIIAIETEMTPEIYEVNVGGTKNVCEACLKHKVRRLVYTSTVHTLYFKNNKEILTEPDRYYPEKLTGAYAISKAEASNIVIDYAAKGLETVLALPSGVVGTYEYRRSNLGQMVADVADRKLPAGVTGRYDFVDVKDVAAALCDLKDKGVSGESYILSGHILTAKQLIKHAASAAGVKPPWFYAPNFLVRLVARFIEKRAVKKGKRVTFSPYSLKVLKDNCNFSHAKIAALTGYSPRSIDLAVKEQVEFFKTESNRK